MDRGLVQDQDVLHVQPQTELTFQPAVEGIGVAGALKEEGGSKITPFKTGGDQRDARPYI